MKSAWIFALLLASGTAWTAESCPDLLNFSLEKLRSKETVDFCDSYRGKVILAVNTASQCGYTPQFKGLEALYQKYRDRGLVVLGFPSDAFDQEYDDPAKTAEVCYLNYGVTFPMFAQTAVTGDNANAFFRKLTAATGQAPAWNFYKYLIDANGQVMRAFPSRIAPESPELQSQIEALLPVGTAGPAR